MSDLTKMPKTRGQGRAERHVKEAGISDPAAATAVIETKEALTSLARAAEDFGAALVPLIVEHHVTPWIARARAAYETADAVLKKTPLTHFHIADTVYNGLPHQRGLSEARIMLLDRVTEEVAAKIKLGDATEETLTKWTEQGFVGAEMIKEWLGEILDDMGAVGW